MDIIRHYPEYKKCIEYPERYSDKVFAKYKELKNDIEIQNRFEKWKQGINYNTNRKIKIGGEIHNTIKRQFIINCNWHNDIIFDQLDNIKINAYLNETTLINKEIDDVNKEIRNYNNIV